MKLSIIGAGNMGSAMLRGFIGSGQIAESDIAISNPSIPKLHKLAKEYVNIRTTTSNVEAIKDSDIIFIAVKPWKLSEVAAEIKPFINYGRQIIASVVAGFDLNALNQIFETTGSDAPTIFRIIPNTAAAVGESMTFASSINSNSDLDGIVKNLLTAFGKVSIVEERMMTAGMCVASCGIAYVMRFIRALTEGGVELGLFPSVAQQAAVQTILGAARLLELSDTHPEQEIDKVTTAGGFTIRGLNAMEDRGFTPSVINGLKASAKNDD